MRRVFVCLAFLISFSSAYCQSDILDNVKKYVIENEDKYRLSGEDLMDLTLIDEYYSEVSKVRFVYSNQTIDGTPIENAIITTVMDKEGKILYTSSSAITNAKTLVIASNEATKADAGLNAAARYLGITNPRFKQTSDRDSRIKFTDTNFSSEDVTTKKVYQQHEGKLVLVWEYQIYMKNSADIWSISVDAQKGEVISKDNLTIYCTHHKDNFVKSKHHKHDHNLAKSVLSPFALSEQADEMYRVFALPAESPSHGDHVLIPRPDYDEASPEGWHSTIDETYTTTRGNNVFTFSDRDNNNVQDSDIPLPDGDVDLVFDFAYDSDLEPLSNVNASNVNLFYMNNMMHDLFYYYGFDEASGNFQSNNFGKGGQGGDYVLAQSLDGALVDSLNNANFATPGDGGSGRMQMYLWTASNGAIQINTPEVLAGVQNNFGEAQFGNPIPEANETPISGALLLADDGSIQIPSRSCDPLQNDMTGKIALVDRGTCDFSEKVFHAQNAGAIACVICNVAGVNGGNGESTLGMAAGDNSAQVTIPSVFVQKSFCDLIKQQMSQGNEVTMTLQRQEGGPAFLDGSFDNGIIAHEYGHGISNRLTGGPSLSSCLFNDEQMGEGWSDFFALVTTVEPGDQGSDIRGIGTFPSQQPTGGGGIRRFPYSTDMAISPYTFDFIKGTGSSPHQLGEVWASMLWDLYWAMVDKYDYDADWKNIESGNGRAIRLVMDGMKMQACNPGFIQGRDAIIAADNILYGGENECLLWDVFARRGLGINASGGSSANRGDGVENFEALATCIEKLKIKKSTADLVDAGTVIDVELNVINHIPQTLSGIIVEDQLPVGSKYVDGSSNIEGSVSGSAVQFALGEMAYEAEQQINYKVELDVTSSKTVNLFNVDDDFDFFAIEPVSGFSTWSISFDKAKSEELSFFIRTGTADEEHHLITPPMKVEGSFPALRFWHEYLTLNVDAGYLQISKDDGATWENIEDLFIKNGYNSNVAYELFAVPGLRGFSGTTDDEFIDTYIDLRNYKGEEILVKFIFGTSDDGNTTGNLTGWYIDDIEMVDLVYYETMACVNDSSLNNEACTDLVQTVINSNGVFSSNKNESFNKELKIVPNPTNVSTSLIFNAPVSGNAQVSIFSNSGKLFSKKSVGIVQNENIIELQTGDLPVGVYFVRIASDNFVATKKMIKI